jgi:hypothetical protein
MKIMDVQIPYLIKGKLKPNVEPLPSLLLLAYICPSCAFMMFFDIYSPKPVPPFDLVANFENNFGRII